MKNILILHGWKANPKILWFPKVKKELEKLGYNVFVPKLPRSRHPKQHAWLEVVKKFKPNKDWILAGHSLGGTTILRYLEQTRTPIGKVVLLATPLVDCTMEEISDFFKTDFNWDKIAKHTKKATVLVSDDDYPFITISAQGIANKLNGDLITLTGHGHNLETAPITSIVETIIK